MDGGSPSDPEERASKIYIACLGRHVDRLECVPARLFERGQRGESEAFDLLGHFNWDVEPQQRVPDAREIQTVLHAGADQLLFRIVTPAVTLRQLSGGDEALLEIR